ncbi:hypothetical protein C8F04DRAFT_1098768 [Mycena alexandri]|uniref:DUF4139 domain-containing protein n=1 Tax=Mycena alexandri TaxID=1745969 RepID=A0AAD6X7T1_9AGAR|nr:hypothetical protein C8F04DRAFT_1098768 [Mycena alexandri]
MVVSLKISAPENPIKAVTVYKSRKAEVVRIFSLNLQSGSTKIEITELPSCIDTQSVRVSGLGDARLYDVVCTTREGFTKSSETVRLLRVQKAALEGEKRVRDHESDLLVTYAKTLKGEHVSPPQMGDFLQSFVEQGRKNLQAVAELDEKIVVLNRQIEVELQKETTKKGASNAQVTIVVGTDSDTHVDLKLTYLVLNASWESTYELHAATDNSKPSSSVSLHYRARITQSTGEDWNDTALTLSTVAASTVAKSIPWLNPIKIRPQSHSPWKGARPAQAGSLFNNNNQPAGSNIFTSSKPFASQNNTLPPLFGQPTGFGAFAQGQPAGGLFGAARAQGTAFGGAAPQQQPQAQSSLFGGTSAFGTGQTQALFGSGQNQPAAAFGAQPLQQQQQEQQPQPSIFQSQTEDPVDSLTEDFEDIDIPGAQAGPTTIVTETPLAISYAVEGSTTVPSDGTVHQVSVAVLPFEAKISHICTPRVDPRVYLQCHVRNTSEYRLLPGPVSVVLNDGFVSKTSINEINTGDTFTCTLGDDVATKVTYARSSNTVTAQGGSFTEVFNTTTYNTKITIHNKHPFALTDLVVRDIIPTCDDKRAKVLLRKPAGLADAKDGEVVKLASPGLKVMWGKTSDGRSGEKDGRFEWAWSVDGGAKVVLEAEWELKAPADVAWVESVPVF